MGSDPALRCEMVREARAVLCRHFIDIGNLQITIGGRSVYLAGKLTRLPGASGSLNAELIDVILREVHTLRHVAAVYADFENWTESGGTWTERGAGMRKPVAVAEEVVPVYDLDKDPEEGALS